MQEIIYKTKPFKLNWFHYVVFGLIILMYLISDRGSFNTAFFLFFIIVFSISIFSNYFDFRIIVYRDKFFLFKKGIFGKKIRKYISISDIESITWNEGGNNSPTAIWIYLKEKSINDEIKVPVFEDAFGIAPLLKFFKSKGVRIKLLSSDYELQMYLDGKIDEFPMKME